MACPRHPKTRIAPGRRPPPGAGKLRRRAGPGVVQHQPLMETPPLRPVPQRTNMRPIKDPLDLHPVPPQRYTRFQGAARSRIHTVARHHEVTFTIASYHYWGSTLPSDQDVPLLFTVAHPVARLDKPNTVSRTPEYHLGPVALSPVDTADLQSSVLRRRDMDPQLAPTRCLEGLQRAIYDRAHAAGRVRALRFRH